MAEVIWTEPAIVDLDAIADYIALDNPEAARSLMENVFEHVDQPESHPDSGSLPSELGGKRYRQVIEPPCRVIYRHSKADGRVFILHVMCNEQRLRRTQLRRG